MKFPNLVSGRLIRRYKRFLADIELSDGSLIVAHCPNPGSMKTMNTPGAQVWLSPANNPKRKLAYTWELIEADGQLTLVHAARANDIVAEGLKNACISELCGFSELHREVRYGDKSRIDFQLLWPNAPAVYVEVKSVTMADGEGAATFPDSVTSRGTKHLQELMRMVELGHRAVLLFCVTRQGVLTVRPCDEIDPVYGKTLREAAAKGVELLAYGCHLSTKEILLDSAVPIDLQ